MTDPERVGRDCNGYALGSSCACASANDCPAAGGSRTDPERVEALAEVLCPHVCATRTRGDIPWGHACRNVAQALAPLLAEWWAADRAEALREAASEMLETRLDLSARPTQWRDEDQAYNEGIGHSYRWLRDRATVLAAEPNAGECACGRVCGGEPEAPACPSAEPDAGGDRG